MRFASNSVKSGRGFELVLANVTDAEVRSAVARLDYMGEIKGEKAYDFAVVLNRKCLENKLPHATEINYENAPEVAATLANRLADCFEVANV